MNESEIIRGSAENVMETGSDGIRLLKKESAVSFILSSAASGRSSS